MWASTRSSDQRIHRADQTDGHEEASPSAPGGPLAGRHVVPAAAENGHRADVEVAMSATSATAPGSNSKGTGPIVPSPLLPRDPQSWVTDRCA